MKKLILLALFVFMFCSVYAQTSLYNDDITPYIIVEEKPLFQGGGFETFNKWVLQQFVYPDEAKSKGIQGRIAFSFVIKEDGSATDIRILNNVDPLLEKEMVRVVSMAPKWTPAKQNGSIVPVRFTTAVVFQFPEIKGKDIVYEYVDLGLSVKWATNNIGASTPENQGNYYAWGEINTKYDCGSANSTTFGKKMGDISGNPQYDVARAKWGNGWRIPTKAEFKELIENCDWTWMVINGMNGYKVTSRRNGKSIFLPAAGNQYESWYLSKNEKGHYWTSTPDENDPDGSYQLYFHDKTYDVSWSGRWGGNCIRPVMD